KGALSGEHLIQDQSKGKDVTARVDVLACSLRLQLLRRHVIERADDFVLARKRHGKRRVIERLNRLSNLCESEVQQLDAGFGHQYVGRLQVAMDDALFVRGVKSVANL